MAFEKVSFATLVVFMIFLGSALAQTEFFRWRRNISGTRARETAEVKRETSEIAFRSESRRLPQVSPPVIGTTILFDFSIPEPAMVVRPKGDDRFCYVGGVGALTFDILDDVIAVATNGSIFIADEEDKYEATGELSFADSVAQFSRVRSLLNLCAFRKLQRLIPVTASDPVGKTRIDTLGLGSRLILFV